MFEAVPDCHFHKASTSAAIYRIKDFVRIKEKYWELLSTLFSGSAGFPLLESTQLFKNKKKKKEKKCFKILSACALAFYLLLLLSRMLSFLSCFFQFPDMCFKSRLPFSIPCLFPLCCYSEHLFLRTGFVGLWFLAVHIGFSSVVPVLGLVALAHHTNFLGRFLMLILVVRPCVHYACF